MSHIKRLYIGATASLGPWHLDPAGISAADVTSWIIES